MSRSHNKDILNNVSFALCIKKHLITTEMNIYKGSVKFTTGIMSCL